MNSDVSSVRSTLDVWRERGADRLDPIRFHFIEALDRRAASHSGEARRILDDRLSKLIEAYATDYAEDLENTASRPVDAGEPVRGALAGLVEYMSLCAPVDSDGPAAGHALPRPSSYPDMEVLDYFRKTWTQVSTERQFRQSLAQVPGNAGPLNSSSLVHRSLALMRELSPGYLQQFLSYIDALSWMEQMNGGGTLPDKDAPRSASPRKSTGGKPRKR
ncbi:DUF2894 domain-containing protein [Burkholderia sp. S171]|uniref:DUF2894 domain-containing protein n=1 Tax=Burkholderia sp. S171 TaxID=1641860 RepID=UPI00131BFC89|nr:DUF2894 domain-containing protein [Burkholderia sp. S171]